MKRTATTVVLALSAALATASWSSPTPAIEPSALAPQVTADGDPTAGRGLHALDAATGSTALFAQDLTQAELRAEIVRLAKIGDTRSLTSVMKRDEFQTREMIVATALAMGNNPGPELGEALKQLKKAWKAVYDTNFVSRIESYYQLMSPPVRRAHTEAITRMLDLTKKINTARESDRSEKRTRTLKGLADQALQSAQGFVELGDHYYAAEMFLLAGVAVNKDTLGEDDANLVLTFEAYQGFITAREEIELELAPLGVVKTSLEHLKSLGAALDPNSAAGLELGAAVPSASSFETNDDFSKLERMNYWADDAILGWQVVPLGRVGSTATMANVEGGPVVERTSYEMITIKPVEGDPIEVSLSGRPVLVETTIGRGGDARPWSFVLQNASNPEYFFGIAMNMAPTAEFLSVYVAPAAAAVIDVGGTEVKVFDDNMDGEYGSDPLFFTQYGMREKEYEAVVDSVIVGKEKEARPWSSLLEVDGAWYHLESVANGKTFKVSPAELNTGQLKLKAKGIKYSSLLLKGIGQLEGVVIDVSGAKKAIDVPAGKYQILGGTVRDGGRSPMKATITPPRNGGTIVVTPDQEAEIELGAPFGFDFIAERDGSEVTVLGESVVPVGVMGERYHRLWNARSQPEIKVRKAGAGRGGKGTKMQLIGDPQSVNDIGQNEAWKPLDQSVENKFGDEVEVQLTEKKHKLFGKMESEWKSARD